MPVNRSLIALGATALLVSASPVLAQGAAPAAASSAAATAPAGTPSAAPNAPVVIPDAVKAWGKFCDPQPKGGTVCVVRKLAFKDSSLAAAISLRIDSHKGVPVVVNISVPTGLLIRPGVKWQIDKQRAVTLPFGICTPQTCQTEQQLTPAVLTQLHKGTTLTLTAVNASNKPYVVSVPLSGFSTVYDEKNAPTFAEFSKNLTQAQSAAGNAPASSSSGQ